MVFRATVKLADAGAAQRAIRGKMALETRRRMEEAGREMARDANDLLASKTEQREFERRRDPGSRRAVGSIDYRAEGEANFPITLGFRVLGGEAVLRRVIILNFGSSGHTIEPSGRWSLAGITNVNRFVRPGSTSGRPDMLAWPDAGGVVFARRVGHPGTKGLGFLEEARDNAVRRLTS